MEREAELGGVAKRTGPKQTPCFEIQRFIETPFGLKRLNDDNTDEDLSGFREERGNMKRLINMEREMRHMEEVMSSMVEKQDKLIKENTELKDRLLTELCSSIVYKFTCPSCQAGYVESTTRAFKVRVNEHKGQSSRMGHRSHNPPHSAVRDHSEVQYSTQKLDQDVEEVIRLGRFSEGDKRPMKVRMRSQVAMEEIMIRKGKLADDTESKDIRIRDELGREEEESVKK
ncbi:hypothetical protein E2C01_010877 [Portunus trituberculatus]|uniref:Uncharacterized protein n=1 Tax=Portunus trituberculatus TaxID=210409 RepID=A0A5B7DA24_PORTR|nr:hypothetical protein [Portunus trituberculatus]